jgi:hypothetical protein
VAAVAVFAAIGWRVWRRLPDPDVAPAFDLVLALLAYKLFFRRVHRDYIQIAALTFLLVLVASTIAHSFVFVATFAVYVVVAVWALILFHLRREMEENYLIKHSAQAPSQKVGVGRILGSRRVVGGSFFAATAGMAALVLVGAVAIFMLVPRVGAGFAVGVTRMSGSASGFADEIAIGRYGTRAAHRHDVVLRATMPDGAIAAPKIDTADSLYFRGATYDGYEGGRWVHSHKPELRTIVERDGARFVIGEDDGVERGKPVFARRDPGEQLIRQEIEAIGIPPRCWSQSTVRSRSSCPPPSSVPPARCACFHAGRARRRYAWAPARATRSSRCRTPTTSRTRGPFNCPGKRVCPSRRARRTSCFRATSSGGWRIWPPRWVRPTRATTRRSPPSRAPCARNTDTPSSRAHRPRASIPSRASCSGSALDIASCSHRRRCC